MISLLNYLIEANLALCLLIIVYSLLLKRETDFRASRFILLFGILVSLVAPLFKFLESSAIPQLGNVIPTVWLPEFRLNGLSETTAPGSSVHAMRLMEIIYAAGVVLFLAIFVSRLVNVINLLRRSRPVRQGSFWLAESTKNIPTFSFFNYIFIGQSNSLNALEKQQIIEHENVHRRQFHSLDLLLLNIIHIFFWFNPVIKIYKRIFVQLHEFEADARAVKTNELNEYCDLLARVALLSADLKIANHFFAKSLTLKRIEMIRKLKMKIPSWKIALFSLFVPLCVFVVACNDQVMNEVTEVAQSSDMALDAPQHIKDRLEKLQSENPDKNFILLHLNSTGSETLKSIETKMGLPVSMEVFKIDSKGEDEPSIKAEAAAGIVFKKEDTKEKNSSESYVILEYNSTSKNLSALSQQEDGVFTIVDETASYKGGITEFYKFLSAEMKYPQIAKMNKIEGKVIVEFIVEPDGSVTNAKVIRSVEPTIDAEALRVVSLAGNWSAGKQNGKPVRQKLVLPIAFSLGYENGILKKTSATIPYLFPVDPKKKEDKC